jgi:uncharacterized protein YgiM (DUF1202 family)
MKRLLGFLLAALLLCGPVCGALASATDTAYTCNLGGELNRVRLRRSPSANAETLGKYFANVQVEVLARDGKWWRVRVGDREGYMMSDYLSATKQASAEARQGISGMICRPGEAAVVPLYADTDLASQTLLQMDAGIINVLATVGCDWLQVCYTDESGRATVGYALTEDIGMTENYATALVKTDSLQSRLNLRADAAASARTLGRYYAGTAVHLLFDDHANDDGWAHVRIGDTAGYVMDKYLDFSSGGVPLSYPPFSRALQESIPLFARYGDASAADSVSEADNFQVLGERGTRSYIRILTDTPVAYRYGYVETASIRAVTGSVSSSGTMKAAADIYDFIQSDAFFTATDFTAPAKARVWILGSVTPGADGGTSGYVRRGDTWLNCVVELSANHQMFGYVPLADVSFSDALTIER